MALSQKSATPPTSVRTRNFIQFAALGLVYLCVARPKVFIAVYPIPAAKIGDYALLQIPAFIAGMILGAVSIFEYQVSKEKRRWLFRLASSGIAVTIMATVVFYILHSVVWFSALDAAILIGLYLWSESFESKRIRVKLRNGKTGTVESDEFDPTKMTRI